MKKNPEKRLFRIQNILFCAVAVIGLVFSGCGDPETQPETKPAETPPPSGGTVTSVTVNPSTAFVAKGGTQTFTVTVTGTNNPAQTVTWSLASGPVQETSISGGVLTVAANETAAAIVVIATSTVDNSKSGVATVTVTDDTSPLHGTWNNTTTGRSAVFSGNTFEYKVNGTITYSGTFYVIGSTINFVTSAGPASGNFLITGTTLTLSNHTWDNDVNGTYERDASAITFDSVTANGSETETTTQLTLSFNLPIAGLSADDITVSGVDGVTKGTLSGSGPTYTLTINGVTAGGTLTVAVAKSNYTITPSSQTVTIFYNSSISNNDVTLNSVTANNSAETTTQLTLVFSEAITGLSADDITVSGVDGVTKGTLSGSGPTYTLTINGVTAGGNLTVAAAKSGYNINGSPKTVPIYYVSGTSGLSFTLISSNTAYSVKKGTATAAAIIIPATYEGKPVTQIASSGFNKYTNLTSITIPSTITTIDYSAFSGCTNLTGVTIPNSVTSIGSNAFDSCTNLTSITIPDSVRTINSYAFYACTKLASVTIGSGVRSMDNPFLGSVNLTNITVDSANQYFTSEGGILYNKTKTTIVAYPSASGSYTVPSGVTKIGYLSFTYSNITGINLSGVTSIDAAAFGACSKLAGTVVIPSGVTSIEYQTFQDCANLTGISIPSGVTSIGDSAFLRCSKLAGVTIPDTVTNIGYSAFSYCSKLTSVIIPNNVTSIGMNAFYNCTGLTSVTIGNKVATIESAAFSNCTGLTSIVIPDSVTSLGTQVFLGCEKLASVNIPNGITAIKDYTFSRTKISSITIPNTITSIGDYAFNGCTSLTGVTFEGTITSANFSNYSSFPGDLRAKYLDGGVGKYTTSNPSAYSPTWTKQGDTPITFSGLTQDGSSSKTTTKLTLTFSSAITGLTESNITLSGVSGVTVGTLSGSGSTYELTISGFTSGGTLSVKVSKAGYSITDSTKTVTIYYNNSGGGSTNTVTTITDPSGLDNYITNQPVNTPTTPYTVKFNGSSLGGSSLSVGSLGYRIKLYLTKYVILDFTGSTITVIEQDAFKGCTNITSVIIPSGVTIIKNGAFDGCTGITSINIPNSVTTIENNAFNGCTGLTSVNIPNSVTTIGSNAFNGCTNLTNITIPDSVINIGEKALDGTAWFTGKPNGLVYAGKVVYVYKGDMSANTTITIDSGTKGIASYAFKNCTNLIDITIPNTVIRIGEYAFNGCTGLTSLIIPNSVTGIEGNAFTGCTNLVSVTFQGIISSSNFDTASFLGDLRAKYLAGGIGTYTTTAPVNSSSVWTRQLIPVTFNSVTANGSSSQNTTQLTLTFDSVIDGLTASDITLSGVSGIIKGNLSDSGSTYYLPVSGFTSGGTLTVAVSKSGYNISNSSKTVTINYNSPALTGVVTVTGTAQVGYSLTANTSNLLGSGAISYQWKRGDTASTATTVISGATSNTYSPVLADAGKYISVTVTRAGNTGSVTCDAAVGPVAAAPVGDSSLGITITMSNGIDEETVAFSPSGSLNLPANGNLTVTVSGTYQYYRWFIDNVPNDETTGSLTLNGSDYSLSTTHRILVIVYKNGVPYSQDINFTVVN